MLSAGPTPVGLPLLILRPEPAASASMARAAALGIDARCLPLFVVEPLAWTAPDADSWDAILLTSANAARLAGPELAMLDDLPCWCVGQATATAARAAGLNVVRTGNRGVQALIDATQSGEARLLWLAGEDRSPLVLPTEISVTIIPVYHARPVEIDPAALTGPAVAMLHSERAARRLAALTPDRSRLSIIAISAAVAQAAGTGWAATAISATPDDRDMVVIAQQLCQQGGITGAATTPGFGVTTST